MTEKALFPSKTRTIPERIGDYLSGGGLFNPELANHDAVSDLLMDCRDEVDRLRKGLEEIACGTQTWERGQMIDHAFEVLWPNASGPETPLNDLGEKA